MNKPNGVRTECKLNGKQTAPISWWENTPPVCPAGFTHVLNIAITLYFSSVINNSPLPPPISLFWMCIHGLWSGSCEAISIVKQSTLLWWQLKRPLSLRYQGPANVVIVIWTMSICYTRWFLQQFLHGLLLNGEKAEILVSSSHYN